MNPTQEDIDILIQEQDKLINKIRSIDLTKNNNMRYYYNLQDVNLELIKLRNLLLEDNLYVKKGAIFSSKKGFNF